MQLSAFLIIGFTASVISLAFLSVSLSPRVYGDEIYFGPLTGLLGTWKFFSSPFTFGNGQLSLIPGSPFGGDTTSASFRGELRTANTGTLNIYGCLTHDFRISFSTVNKPCNPTKKSGLGGSGSSNADAPIQSTPGIKEDKNLNLTGRAQSPDGLINDNKRINNNKPTSDSIINYRFKAFLACTDSGVASWTFFGGNVQFPTCSNKILYGTYITPDGKEQGWVSTFLAHYVPP